MSNVRTERAYYLVIFLGSWTSAPSPRPILLLKNRKQKDFVAASMFAMSCWGNWPDWKISKLMRIWRANIWWSIWNLWLNKANLDHPFVLYPWQLPSTTFNVHCTNLTLAYLFGPSGEQYSDPIYKVEHSQIGDVFGAKSMNNSSSTNSVMIPKYCWQHEDAHEVASHKPGPGCKAEVDLCWEIKRTKIKILIRSAKGKRADPYSIIYLRCD